MWITYREVKFSTYSARGRLTATSVSRLSHREEAVNPAKQKYVGYFSDAARKE